jgi:hypothetical protein
VLISTACSSAGSAGASCDYRTSNKVLTLSISSLPSHYLLPPSTHLPTALFFTPFPRCAGGKAALEGPGWVEGNSTGTRKPVRTNTFGGVAKIWEGVAKISKLYCTIPHSSAQRSDVAGGSQRSAGGRRHR